VDLYGEYAITNGLDPSYFGNQKTKSNFYHFDLINKNVQDNKDLEEIIETLFKDFKISTKDSYIPILIDVGIFRRLLKVCLFYLNNFHSS